MCSCILKTREPNYNYYNVINQGWQNSISKFEDIFLKKMVRFAIKVKKKL